MTNKMLWELDKLDKLDKLVLQISQISKQIYLSKISIVPSGVERRISVMMMIWNDDIFSVIYGVTYLMSIAVRVIDVKLI